MAHHHERWLTLDEHTFSSSSFSYDDHHHVDKQHEENPHEPNQDFAFMTCSSDKMTRAAAEEEDMCAADEVFFKGKILPVHPSGLLPASRSESSRSTSASGLITSSRSSSGSSIRSASNNFYAQPSPNPQIRQAKRSGRRTTRPPALPGWGLFRMERFRRTSINLETDKIEKKMGVVRFPGIGLSCRCSADAVAEAATVVERGKREETIRGRRRIVEWDK